MDIPTGRQLDTAIAREIMQAEGSAQPYSSNITLCMQVVDRMKHSGWHFSLYESGEKAHVFVAFKWYRTIGELLKWSGQAHGPDRCTVICQAALRAWRAKKAIP